VATVTADLVAWLLADDGPIAADEALARAAMAGPGREVRDKQWVEVPDDGVWTQDHGTVVGKGIHIYDEGGHDPEQAAHIAAWDPARVLAECAAKRQIIAAHPHDEVSAYGRSLAGSGGHPIGCNTCHNDDGVLAGGGWCPTLLALAQPYAGRDGWRDEWAT
jgi:hypothetical protein